MTLTSEVSSKYKIKSKSKAKDNSKAISKDSSKAKSNLNKSNSKRNIEQCIVCHKLNMDPKSDEHDWDHCPKKDEYFEELELKGVYCPLCCTYTRYYADVYYVCLGACIERQKRGQDLTSFIKESKYIIRQRPNPYMISDRKRNKYRTYENNYGRR